MNGANDHLRGTGEPGRVSPPGAPLWVKVFGIITLLVLLLFVVSLVTGSNHGPGRHLDGGKDQPAGADHVIPHP